MTIMLGHWRQLIAAEVAAMVIAAGAVVGQPLGARS
jgi:hypothetical protein